jgi:hypothetical protein
MESEYDAFISYARDDDKNFVKRLYKDLCKEGFNIWLDEESMPNRGLTFRQEIVNAISSAGRFIIVLGPAASVSRYVPAEEEEAVKRCKAIIPILRVGRRRDLPEKWRKLQVLDFGKGKYKTEIKNLIRILKQPPVLATTKIGHKLPEHFSPRSSEVDFILEVLRPDLKPVGHSAPAAKSVYICGMGGMGKSVLATALAHDCGTRCAFSDGIARVDIGQVLSKGSPLKIIRQVASGLGDTNIEEKYGDIEDIEGAKFQLGTFLTKRTCLIILDNAWHQENIQPVENALEKASGCRILITTRLKGLADGAFTYELKALIPKAALKLLADWADKPVEDLASEAKLISERCGRLPFALAQCGAMVKKKRSWASILVALQKSDLSSIRKRLKNYREYETVFQCIDVNVNFLKEEKYGKQYVKLYTELAVFPRAKPVPESVVLALWQQTSGLETYQLDDILPELQNRSLISLEDEQPSRKALLHDLHYDYIKANVKKVKRLHQTLGKSLIKWWFEQQSEDVSDVDVEKEAYIMEHLLFHLIEAEDWDGIKKLLSDINYLEKRHQPAEQLSFQKDFEMLLKSKKIPTSTLCEILKSLMEAVTSLKLRRRKADWLDTIAFWIDKLGIKGNKPERASKLKLIAAEFDKACGEVSGALADNYLSKRTKESNGWAVRFAELQAWVYQRAEVFDKCAKACDKAKIMCRKKDMPPACKKLGCYEFMRMGANALSADAKKAHGAEAQNKRKQVKEAYEKLSQEFMPQGTISWKLTVKEWEKLAADSKSAIPRRFQIRKPVQTTFRAIVVSNAHDCISAMYILQFLEKNGGRVEWIHHEAFQPDRINWKNYLFLVFLGGPKAPGISSIADKFYETNKRDYLRMYSGLYFEHYLLQTNIKGADCYMLGGISKVNTMMAAYQFTNDHKVNKDIKSKRKTQQRR